MPVSEPAVERPGVVRRPDMSRWQQLTGSVIALAGLIVVVVGTFAPWLASGGVERNSYAIAGIVHRLGLAGDGFGAAALGWWPFVGPLAMVALIAGILQRWRTAAWIAITFGIAVGVIGGGVSAVAGGHTAMGIALAHTGPTVTLIGAFLAVLGGAMILVADRGRRRVRGRRRAETRTASGEPFVDTARQSARRVPDGSSSDVHTSALEGTDPR